MGDSTRICHSTGIWTGSEPTCQSMLLLPHMHCSEGQDFDSVHLLIFPCKLEVKYYLLCTYELLLKTCMTYLSVSCVEILAM